MIKIKINNVFESAQGEGRYAGNPVLFIRVSGCNRACPFCFGVKPNRKIPKVITLHKNKKITEIKKGDELITLNNKHDKVITIVKKIIKREVDEWYEIKINNKLYFVTPEHPFFTKRGLITAENLKINDIIYHITPQEKISFNKKIYNPSFNKNDILLREKNPYEKTKNKLLKYYHNGFEIQSIKKVNRNINKNGNKYKYDYFKRQKLKVYNLSCEPYNTYLIDYMWVHNCDTKYHIENTELSVQQLVTKIKKSDKAIVVWTGGEPMLQIEEIKKVIEKTKKHFHHLETNGDIPVEEEIFDYVCFSPKCQQGLSLSLDYNKKCDIKVVTDLKLNSGLLDDATMLMPLTNYDESDSLIEKKVWNYCVKHNKKFCLRQHVHVWGAKKGK